VRVKKGTEVNKRPILGLAISAAALVAALVPALSHAGASNANGEIAFSARVHGVSQVFTVNPDGTQQRQVTHGTAPAGQYGLAWSPNGRGLLFTVTQHRKDRLLRSRADGSGITAVNAPCTGNCLGDDNPDYSPNGKKIVFERAFGPVVNGNASGLALFTVNADGSALKQLTRESKSSDTQAHWSPDGQKIAFVHFDNVTYRQAIEVMSSDGRNVRRLTPYSLNAGDPRWSSDGKLVLYNSYGGPVQHESANLFTMHPDGTHRVQLTHYKGGTLQAYADDWSPDGSEIVFRRLSFSGNDSEVGGYYILDLGTKHVRRLTPVRLTYDAQAAWGRKP
jgi:Tol biopolymer transport system component